MFSDFSEEQLYKDLEAFKELKASLRLEIFPPPEDSIWKNISNEDRDRIQTKFHHELGKHPLAQKYYQYALWALESEDNEFIFRKAVVKVFWNVDIKKEDTVIP